MATCKNGSCSSKRKFKGLNVKTFLAKKEKKEEKPLKEKKEKEEHENART